MANPPADSNSSGAHFRRAAIIGAGLIGGSLGMALRLRGLAAEVVASARTDETLRLACDRGAADRATRDITEAVAGADLVVLAAPVSLIIEHLEVIAAAAAGARVITDVGSVKQPVVAAACDLLPHPGRFVGGHPLAGSERRGIAAARPDLFEGAAWVLTPTAATEDEALRRVQGLVERLGARPVTLSPLEHDQLAARTSHLPHMAAAALMLVVAQRIRESSEARVLIGKGFRDTTRIAAGDAALWADIALANADALLEALVEAEACLGRFATALRRRDRPALEELLGQAQRAREGLNEG